MAAVNRILRPVIAGEQPSRLRIDVIAVKPDQRPFLCGQAYAVEILLGKTEIIEFAYRIGLQVDPTPSGRISRTASKTIAGTPI